MPTAQVQSLLEFLREHSQIAEPAHVSSDSCRDPKDLPILGTALADKVDCLVSGDEDLLMLGQFNGIPILSPRTFYEKLL